VFNQDMTCKVSKTRETGSWGLDIDRSTESGTYTVEGDMKIHLHITYIAESGYDYDTKTTVDQKDKYICSIEGNKLVGYSKTLTK